MQFRTGRRRSITALLAAAGLVAGSGVAAAQIAPLAPPGTDDSAIQVAVDQDLATVEVTPAGGLATEIEGTFTNDTNGTLTCAAPGGTGDAGTVTHEDLVNRSLAYLEGNVLPPAPPLPGVNPGSLDVMLGGGSLGSLGLGDAAAVELDEIQQAQDQARLAGHYGTVEEFTVDRGETHDWSATLTVPSGDRTNFDAAVLFTCADDDGQWYAVAGYEHPDGNSAGGSLDMGSLGAGSLES